MDRLGVEMPVVIVAPFLPPTVNHYVKHGFSRGKPYHRKTPEALAFAEQMGWFVRGQFVTGKRFSIALVYRMGPSDGYDVDNLNKCVLDTVAAAGAIRDAKGKWLSDRWFKRMTVEIDDSDEARKFGQQTRITIEAIA